jgi:hypothetical protein
MIARKILFSIYFLVFSICISKADSGRYSIFGEINYKKSEDYSFDASIGFVKKIQIYESSNGKYAIFFTHSIISIYNIRTDKNLNKNHLSLSIEF